MLPAPLNTFGNTRSGGGGDGGATAGAELPPLGECISKFPTLMC